MRAIRPKIRDKSPLLPEEIIFFEIFARLPDISIFKFRCVSKFCRSLISNPQFLDAHSRLSPRYILSYAAFVPNYNHVFLYLNPSNTENNKPKITKKYVDGRYLSYSKSINGLMCFLCGDQVVIRNLEHKDQLLKLPSFDARFMLDKFYVYFCLDPKKGKYKVLVASQKTDMNDYVVSMGYSIFTLGVDKHEWRKLGDQIGCCQLRQSKSICVDGVLYCTNFSTTSEVENGVIFTFDVGSETFGSITYPKELSPSRYRSCHLIKVKEGVAIVDIGDLERCVMRMWIRVKRLGSECWVENRVSFPSQWAMLYYNNLSYYNFSLTTNRKGEIVLASCGMNTTENCRIFVYNMEKKEWRRNEVLGLQKDTIFGDFLVEDYDATNMLRGPKSEFWLFS